MKRGFITSAIFFLVFFMLNEKAKPQSCREKAENMGLWVRSKDVRPIGQENATTVNNLKKITAVVDSIGALFIKSYPIPFGSKVVWGRVLQPVDSVTLPDYELASYLYMGYVLAYRCINNKIEVDDETPITLVASFNDYYRSGYVPAIDENKKLHQNLFWLPPQQFSVKGYPGFASIANGWAENIREMRYSVLVHKEGKLPYTPVSIKEYFDLCLQLIDFNEKKSIQELNELRKKGYKIEPDDEQKEHEKSEKLRVYVRKQMQRYASKLERPAILKRPEFSIAYDNIVPNEDLFTTANRGYQLVRPNPDYVEKNAEKWKPQYIWISWTVSMTDDFPYPYYRKLTAKLDKMMREVFDFREVEKMLSK
ncbi:MAG: hypothetical protein IRZ01_01210 [Thermoflavifilum aggregans]|nr:hypothetical protein [Thermoflavifilum aggregans]